ncbi:alpha/beta fold hydrolase [Microbacterium sp. A94]|uniref:alpha/beta fold hydrolase n=1 Tax=Microbacterium sp. A94 TaxID=3450717 RepID=UPI003F433569
MACAAQRRRTARNHAPTLALFGSETRLGDPVAAGAGITHNIRGSQVELIPGGGHGLLWQLRDEVMPRITGFLQAHN